MRMVSDPGLGTITVMEVNKQLLGGCKSVEEGKLKYGSKNNTSTTGPPPPSTTGLPVKPPARPPARPPTRPPARPSITSTTEGCKLPTTTKTDTTSNPGSKVAVEGGKQMVEATQAIKEAGKSVEGCKQMVEATQAIKEAGKSVEGGQENGKSVAGAAKTNGGGGRQTVSQGAVEQCLGGVAERRGGGTVEQCPQVWLAPPPLLSHIAIFGRFYTRQDRSCPPVWSRSPRLSRVGLVWTA